MAVLVELARADGKVVSRAELLDRVWQSADVTDDALTQTITELRRALGDDARKPTYIETIKRVGMRLIPAGAGTDRRRAGKIRYGLAVVAFAVLSVAAVVAWLQLRPEPLPPAAASIAVLPFADMSGDADKQYFADGLTEEIISVLAAAPEIRVSARTSSFAYRNRNLDIRLIGERLNVANVLEGSVRRSDNRIRVTAQLIEVGSGYHRWSRSYDHELGDAVAIQQAIANDVVAALAPQLGVVSLDHTHNARAYDLFLAGRQHLHAARFDTAAKLFADAIREDPEFALAQANLAIALTSFHENAAGVRQAHEGSRPSIEIARDALRVAERAGLQHVDRFIAAASIAAFERNVEAEAIALQRAIDSYPRSVVARTRFSANLAARGQFPEALRQLDAVASVDPLNPDLAVRQAGLIALFSGYEAGIERLRRLVDLDLASPVVWSAMAELAADYGRYVDRVRFALAWARETPRDATALAELGDAYTELGELETAGLWIAAAEKYSSLATLKQRARWLAASGDWAAFDGLLQQAVATFGTISDSEQATPVQSAITGLRGLERAHAGDHAFAARLFQGVLAASPTLPRRTPHLRVYIRVLLAREYRALDDDARMNEILDESQVILDEFREAGIEEHPWLDVLQAAVLALRNADDDAERAFDEAIDAGWRAWLLERHGIARPLAGYSAVVDRVERQLRDERNRLRDADLLLRPEDL